LSNIKSWQQEKEVYRKQLAVGSMKKAIGKKQLAVGKKLT
jgi:hypothetical protein